MGRWERDDMTQPLSSYWINGSHDTYLKNSPPLILGESYQDIDTADCLGSAKMYVVALHRGCRCLDVDVWDGDGEQKGQPVVRFGISDHSAKKSVETDPKKKEGILFSNVIRSIKSFLSSNQGSLPVILFIENHCGVSNQEKIAEELKHALAFDDMIYIPPTGHSKNEDEALPSPDELRGKVVIKFKIPVNALPGCSAIFDDYDDENDINPQTVVDKFDENGGEEIVGGIPVFGAAASMISESPYNEDVSLDGLVRRAVDEAKVALDNANVAEENAFRANVRANRAEKLASQVLSKIGMTLSDAEERLGIIDSTEEIHSLENINDQDDMSSADTLNREKSLPQNWLMKENNKIDQVIDRAVDGGMQVIDRAVDGGMMAFNKFQCKGNEALDEGSDYCDDDETMSTCSGTFLSEHSNTGSHVIWLEDSTNKEEGMKYVSNGTKHQEEEAIEVQHFFSSTVENAISDYSRKEAKANAAADSLAIAKTARDKCYKGLIRAEETLKKAETRKRDAAEMAIRTRTEAEEKRRAAIDSTVKVNETQQKFDKCLGKVSSAKNVAGTASAEGEISGQRAAEADKRALRAQAAADSAHVKADSETLTEEELERDAASLQKMCKDYNTAYKAAKQKISVVSGAVKNLEDQILVIKGNPDYESELLAFEASNNEAEDDQSSNEGFLMKKLNGKTKELTNLKEKVQNAIDEKENAYKERQITQKALENAVEKCKEQAKIATKARNQADHSASISEQLAEYAEEGKSVKIFGIFTKKSF